MIFLDINTFFSDRGGGIRTYHRAKIDWFARHPEHAYFVVRPGPGYHEEHLADNVTLVEAYGLRTGEAYRLLLDYGRVLRLIRRVRPDVVEAGDPWLTGWSMIAARRLRLHRGLLASFYHGDTIRTWVEPWAAPTGVTRPIRRLAAALAARFHHRVQRMYDVTVVTSGVIESYLRERGVTALARMPLGADAIFFQSTADRCGTWGSLDVEFNPADRGHAPGVPSAGAAAGRRVRLLFAGRLGKEKGTELLLEILPRVLAMPGVELTVMGRGEFADRLAAIDAPNYRFQGFVADRAEVAGVYRAHDVLLAPGPHETFGLGVLEGLASGLVVVGPDAGGSGEMLREMESRFLFPAGDAELFLLAIQSAVACDLAAESAKSRTAAARYGDWDAALGRLVAYYQSNVESR